MRASLLYASVGSFIVAVLLASASASRAATMGPSLPFDASIARTRLVAVAHTRVEPHRLITVTIDRVLHGRAPPSAVLVFAAAREPPAAVVDGAVVVIAFADSSSIERSAPTLAWQVTDDGIIEPGTLGTSDGLPPTLAAMYTYFGVPIATDRAEARPDLGEVAVPVLLVVAALAFAEGSIAHRGRRARARDLVR
jgi:hypothetical protein